MFNLKASVYPLLAACVTAEKPCRAVFWTVTVSLLWRVTVRVSLRCRQKKPSLSVLSCSSCYRVRTKLSSEQLEDVTMDVSLALVRYELLINCIRHPCV